MNLKNISDLIPSHSLLGHILGKPRQEMTQQERCVARLREIASQYGYKAGAPEIESIAGDTSLESQPLIATAFSNELKWREAFDPRSSRHVKYQNGTLVVQQYPYILSSNKQNYGASRADIVHAWLAEGWEQSCNRIIVDSHITTFFEDGTPVVAFIASGRDSWGRVDNAVDALSTFAGIDIDREKVFIDNTLSARISDLVFEKVNDSWTRVA